MEDFDIHAKIKEAFEHCPSVYWNVLASFHFCYCFIKGLSLKPEHRSNLFQSIKCIINKCM